MSNIANIMDNETLKTRWQKVEALTLERFGEKMDTQSILFVIGIQELGKVKKKFTKDQKLDVLHIAVCTLLSNYGYYEFKGYDDEGWPHWERKEKLPHLRTSEQEQLIQKAIIEYFNF